MLEIDNLEFLRNRNIELEEELKVCKADLRKKDEHIKALSSMEIRRSSAQSESIETRAEVANLQVQLEYANKRAEEMSAEKDELARETREAAARSEEERHWLKQTAQEKEAAWSQLTAASADQEQLRVAHARAETALTAMQQQLAAATDHIVTLEAELRNLRTNSDHASRSRDSMATRIRDFYTALTEHLGLERDSEPDVVFDKIKLLVAEKNLQRGEIVGLKATVEEREQKYLDTRESLRRLTQSLETGQGDLEKYIQLKRDTSMELDKAAVDKRLLESRFDEQCRKISSLEAELMETRRCLDERDGCLSKVDLERRETNHTAKSVAREFEMFRESIAATLGSSLSHCDPSEADIRERLRRLVAEKRELDNSTRQMEERLRSLALQYEHNSEVAKDSGCKARRAELEYLEVKERIKSLERELTARDVCRDELCAEKEQFFHFLRKLATLMKMDPYTKENNFSLIFEGILDRTQQLARSEGARNVDTHRTVSSLQKRVRDLKDQLHSRDLHLEMMRKRLDNQQQELAISDHLDHDNEAEAALKQRLSKMQHRVDALRDENKALKSEIFDLSENRQKASEQSQELESLRHNLAKLERVRQRQAEKIGELSHNVELCDGELGQTRLVSDNAVQSLATELRTLKGALERARRSEKELLDFRTVVGRILSLNVDDLAIPNYDIIRRLEKIVQSPAPGVTVALPVQHCPIRPGYEDANRLLGRKRRSPVRPGVSIDAGRPRSVSPPHGNHGNQNRHRDARRY